MWNTCVFKCVTLEMTDSISKDSTFKIETAKQVVGSTVEVHFNTVYFNLCS